MLDPTYANPWERAGNLKSPEIVDEAVEKNPAVSPRVVEVETYVPVGVNGQAADEMVIGDEPMMTPCEQDEPPEQETVVVATVPKVEGVPAPVQYASWPMVGVVEVETAPW